MKLVVNGSPLRNLLQGNTTSFTIKAGFMANSLSEGSTIDDERGAHFRFGLCVTSTMHMGVTKISFAILDYILTHGAQVHPLLPTLFHM